MMIRADVLVERVRIEVVTLAKADCGCPRGDAAAVQDSFRAALTESEAR